MAQFLPISRIRLQAVCCFLIFNLLGFGVSAATYSENFDVAGNWTLTTAAGSYGAKSYFRAGSPATFAATNVIRETAATQDGFQATYTGSTHAWRMNQAAGNWTATIATGGVGTFSLYIRRWDNSPAPIYIVEYSIDNGSNYTAVQTVDNTWLGSSDWKQVSGTINTSNTTGAADDIIIRVRFSSGERAMIDQFDMTDYGCVPPSTPTITTTAGNYCASVNVARGTPGAGETWYWQTSATGTSTANSSATLTVNTTQTVYLRAQNNTTLCWSTSSASVAITIVSAIATQSVSGATDYCSGLTLSLSVPNLGAGVTYQWQRGGVNIADGNASGVTTNALTITSVLVGQAGDYQCLVTNACGTSPSLIVAVTVAAGGQTVSSFSPAGGPSGTWVTITGTNFSGITDVTFNGTSAADFLVKSTTQIVAVAPAGVTTGKISVLKGGCGAVSASNFTAINTVCSGGSGSLFISELCDPVSNSTANRYIEIYNGTNATINLTGWTVRAQSNNTDCNTWTLSGTIASGQAKTCGTSRGVGFTPDFQTSWPNTVNGCYYNWNGQERDGARLFNGSTLVDFVRKGTTDVDYFANSSQIRNASICQGSTTFNASEWTISAAPAVGSGGSTPGTHSGTTCTPVTPSITSDPVSVTICAGNNATFTLTATGASSYQWYRFRPGTDADFVSLAGETAASITVASVTTGMNGYLYYCRAQNTVTCYAPTVAVRLTVPGPQTEGWSGVVSNSWLEPRNWTNWETPGTGSSLTVGSNWVSALDLSTLPSCLVSLADFTLDKTNAFINNLSANLLITNSLTLTNGVFPTGSFKITVDNAAVGSVAYTSGWVNGTLQRKTTTLGVDYAYPVGSASALQLSKVRVNSLAGGLTYIDQTYVGSAAGAAALGASAFTENNAYFDQIMTNGYWSIHGDAGTATYDWEIFPTWASGATAYALIKRPDAGSWDNGSSTAFIGGAYGSSGKSAAGGIGRRGYSSFSVGTVAISATPFPVEWLGFTATALDAKTVRLNWATATETNNAGFDIERGLTPSELAPVGFVPSLGNNAAPQNYTKLDEGFAPTNRLYYRLKQTDMNGQYKYSQVEEVNFDFAAAEWVLGPNPTSGQLNLIHRNEWAAKTSLRIYDAIGRVVYEAQPASVDAKTLTIDVSKLASGRYFLQTVGDGKVFARPFVKE